MSDQNQVFALKCALSAVAALLVRIIFLSMRAPECHFFSVN